MKIKKQHPIREINKLTITTLLTIGGIFTATNYPAKAQIIPDNTLGLENSIVTKDSDIKDIINGGAARGLNLFHSFEKFNVGENRSVYFANPTGIENILTRVTGGSVSNILGTLGVNGNANLFLINPNGIYFGNGAVLDIRGSFTATTADEIKLGEDGLFSATNPQSSNLLTVQPGALFRNALINQQAKIENKGDLTVRGRNNITLFGANVTNTGTLTAPGGKVQLTGAENLIVRGNINTKILSLDTINLTITDELINDENATLYRATLEELSGNTNLILQATNDVIIHPLYYYYLRFYPGNGKITFTADADGNGIGDFNMDAEDTIIANNRSIEIKGINLTVGNIDTTSEFGGGNITLTAAGGDISTKNLYAYSSSLYGTAGTGGAISLNAKGNISTQSIYSSSSSYSGTGGNGSIISLNAQGDISTESLYSYSYSYLGTAGNGGGISLNAKGDINTQSLHSWSFSNLGTGGNSGSISLFAQGDILTQYLYSTSFSFSSTVGNGGAISLFAQGDILTQSLNSYSYSESGTAGNGGVISLFAGGNIGTITTGSVFSSFSVSQNGTSGEGGNVTVVAKNKITDIDIFTLSSSSKSGDVQIIGFGDLLIKNTNIITSRQLTVDNPFFGTEIILDVSEVGQSGNVNITSTGNLTFNNNRIESDTKGDNPAGNVNITSPHTVTFNNSKIVSNTSSIGDAGNILIDANDLTLTDASEISASTTAEGKAGDITLNTPTLTVANGAEIFATTTGTGDGGTITINADKAVNLGIGVQDSSPILSVETSGAGKAGNIIVNTPNLTVSDTARITATATATATNKQGGGSITLNASKMNLAGVVGVFAETQGQAPAGTLQLNPYQNQTDLDITLFPNSIISASTTAQGKGGDLIITAPENINISGQGKLAVESTGSGDAGNISITTKNLNITDGVKISASTSNIGRGGNININANKFTANNGAQLLTTTSGNNQAGNINLQVKDNITLDGKNTGLFANTEIGSTGKSGSITIDPEIFIIKNGAGIGVNSQGNGEGGDISIEAGLLNLENQAFISAETASNQGGNINLVINDLFLFRNNSQISATAGTDQAGGNGGNITINTPFIIAFPSENSDITANAFEGNGGNINITTNALFEIEFQPQQTRKSDITASSQFGIAGNVQINRPDVDPTSGLLELPDNLVDAESLNKDVCAIKDGKIAGGSSFIITGKGGLPADTNELISNSPAYLEWESYTETVTESKPVNDKVTQENKNDIPEIQEAQGWIITNDGKVILTANAPHVTPQSSGSNYPGCGVFSNK